MIAPEAGLSVSRQCALLGIARSSFYYRPRPESAEELERLKRLDWIFTNHPVYGSLGLTRFGGRFVSLQSTSWSWRPACRLRRLSVSGIPGPNATAPDYTNPRYS